VKKMDKMNGPDADKSECIKLQFLMDPGNLASSSKYSRQFDIFNNGYSEEWIKWMMTFPEIENLMPLKESAHKTSMFRTLLKGKALSSFEHH
jgi:hypothetical protein